MAPDGPKRGPFKPNNNRIKLELINNKRGLCPRTPVFVGLWASPGLRLMIAGGKICLLWKKTFFMKMFVQKLFKVSDVQSFRFPDFQILRFSDSQICESPKN